MAGKTVLYLLLLLMMLVSCTSANLPQVSTIPPVSLPIWPNASLSDPEGTLGLETQQPLLQYSRVLNIRPKFYKGDVPLQYLTLNIISGISSGSIDVIHVYSGWTTFFAYDDVMAKYSGIPSRAVTFDKKGLLIAEALLQGFDNGYAIILEVHYNKDGEVSFWCRSKINLSSLGFKESESDINGKKITDYYFLWPTSVF